MLHEKIEVYETYRIKRMRESYPNIHETSVIYF